MGFGTFRIAVNLSARQVRMQSLERIVLDALAETGLPPACLELELTESVVMDDIAHAVSCLQDLKRHGIQLSLDDFGTGYSSLAYLSRFPIDTLKIDRSFLELVPANAQAVGLVGTIIASARALGMQVIAEGVEREAQVRFLAGIGCDEIQGYYFSKPVPAAQLTAMLLAHERLPARLRRRALRMPAILVVDPDPARRCELLALAAPLLDRGGRILTSASAAEAIRFLGDMPELVVSAARLPDMPGTAFLRIARGCCPAAARILLEAHAPGDGPPPAKDKSVLSIPWPSGRVGLAEKMRSILSRDG
jgi:EAL domain